MRQGAPPLCNRTKRPPGRPSRSCTSRCTSLSSTSRTARPLQTSSRPSHRAASPPSRGPPRKPCAQRAERTRTLAPRPSAGAVSEAKQLVDAGRVKLDAASEVEASVYAAFYFAASQLAKIKKDYADFYRSVRALSRAPAPLPSTPLCPPAALPATPPRPPHHPLTTLSPPSQTQQQRTTPQGLLYLAYVSLATLPEATKKALAVDLSLAALLGAEPPSAPALPPLPSPSARSAAQPSPAQPPHATQHHTHRREPRFRPQKSALR